MRKIPRKSDTSYRKNYEDWAHFAHHVTAFFHIRDLADMQDVLKTLQREDPVDPIKVRAMLWRIHVWNQSLNERCEEIEHDSQIEPESGVQWSLEEVIS